MRHAIRGATAELRRFYGPFHKAFGTLDADTQNALEQELLAMASFNTATDGTLRLPSACAEIVLAKA